MVVNGSICLLVQYFAGPDAEPLSGFDVNSNLLHPESSFLVVRSLNFLTCNAKRKAVRSVVGVSLGEIVTCHTFFARKQTRERGRIDRISNARVNHLNATKGVGRNVENRRKGERTNLAPVESAFSARGRPSLLFISGE